MKLEGLEDTTLDNLCTATQVGANVLLTAGHCFDHGPRALTVVSGDNASSSLPLSSLEITRHETLDIALLRVPGEVQLSSAALPWAESLPAHLPGALVELAGAGLDERGAAGALRFGVTTVATVESRYIETTRDGACGGDSGGPLLTRSGDGTLEILGVLSEGAPTCDGSDRFVRLDALADWLHAHAGAPGSNGVDCPTFGGRGRCFGDVAVWCEDMTVRGAKCDAGSRCGWSDAVEGYRCVDAGSDPCEGVSDLGSCAGKVARRCQGGVVEELDCGACGGECSISSARGVAACSLPP